MALMGHISCKIFSRNFYSLNFFSTSTTFVLHFQFFTYKFFSTSDFFYLQVLSKTHAAEFILASLLLRILKH